MLITRLHPAKGKPEPEDKWFPPLAADKHRAPGEENPTYMIKKEHMALQICTELYTDTEQSHGVLLGKEEFTNTLIE